MTLRREDILDALKKQTSLPSIPDLVIRLEAQLRSDEPSMNEIAEIIEQDPALSMRLLSVANSAFYRRGKEASTVRQAMTRLGFEEIRRLAVAAALVNNYKEFGSENPKLFWGHSLAVAFATKAVAEYCNTPLMEDAVSASFTCGLLHDVGILALNQLFARDYQEIRGKRVLEGGDINRLEMEMFGIDHGEVGGELMRQWELPEQMCNVVTLHHRPWECNPDDKTTYEMVQLIHISDFICNNQGYGRRRQILPEAFEDASWDALGLSLDHVPDIINRVRVEGERSQVFMSAFG